MEDNVALGIRISVTVVLVASLVATVLTLMVIGQSILGGGQNKLQTGLSQIQQQDLEQYANVTKKGSVVKSVINLYQGEPVAILVKTLALQKDTSCGDRDGSLKQAQSGTGNYFNYGVLMIEGGQVPTKDDTDVNGNKHLVFKSGNTLNTPNTGSANLKIQEGVAHLEGALAVKNGVKQTNYDTSGTVAIGNLESILDNGIFYSQLIKDITGQIIGICFTQQK